MWTSLLVLVAMGALVLGGLCLSEATLGVGIIGGACFIGILARIVQAEHDHKELMQRLTEK